MTNTSLSGFAPSFLRAGVISLFVLGNSTYANALSHRAICSYYSRYEPCTVQINENAIHANVPADFIIIKKENFKTVNVYEALGPESRILLGSLTTILLGPIGLLGFLVTKKAGSIDYGIKFSNDEARSRTLFIRFVNLNAASAFGVDLNNLIRQWAEPPSRQGA